MAILRRTWEITIQVDESNEITLARDVHGQVIRGLSPGDAVKRFRAEYRPPPLDYNPDDYINPPETHYRVVEGCPTFTPSIPT
jgi:hypothetical protein